ncbi:MAG: hypothetical protein R2741_15025 [Methanolobus sp.]
MERLLEKDDKRLSIDVGSGIIRILLSRYQNNKLVVGDYVMIESSGLIHLSEIYDK